MPNMCTCGHHYAAHEGYSALEAAGGGRCRSTKPDECDCNAFVHRVDDVASERPLEPVPVCMDSPPTQTLSRPRLRKGGAA